jgi:hypothetical protein
MKLGMHDDPQEISPIQHFINRSIEAGAAPDWVQHLLPSILPLLLLRQIEKFSTRVGHRLHQALRYTVIYHLIIILIINFNTHACTTSYVRKPYIYI